MKQTQRLLDIMARLRDPEKGCPWDIEQTWTTIAPYTIEEAYEVAEAIALGDMPMLKNELGDLLFQVVFYAQMGAEEGLFDFEEIARVAAEKMIRRHPHVFADAHIPDAAAQTEHWERVKQQERNADGQASLMDDVPHALPALMRAYKLQKRAARAGFDWPSPEPVFDKIAEEMDEIREAMQASNQVAVEEEIGDLLFAAANLARACGIRPEEALRQANRKFERRVRAMEKLACENGVDFRSLSIEEQEALWQQVKMYS